MKTNFVLLTVIIVLATLLFCSGCSLFGEGSTDSPNNPSNPDNPSNPNIPDNPSNPNTPNNPTANYSKEYWGEWIRMDTGESWYISSKAISIDGASFTSNVSMSKQSNKVIEVSDSGRKYYLFASRTATARFSGRIAGLSLSARDVSGVGGVEVVVGNLSNDSNEMAVTTAPDGTYTVEGAIPGDKYLIKAGGQTAVITPYNDGDDVGVLTVTDGVNFKTRLIPKVADLDMTRLYADHTTYEFTLEITNNGTEDCTAAIYSLDFDNDLIVPGTVSAYDRLGTIEPGRNKLIDIALACKTIHAALEDKKIRITITDTIAGKTWEDSVSIRFNKAPVHFVIRSEREVNGIIISPNATGTQFSTVWDGTGYGTIASLPWSDRDYLVVFSGATADTEAVYSMGVNVVPDTDYRSFMDLGRYEPNNAEDAATAIMTQDRVTSYLHKNDIDYYRINLSQAPESHPLSLIGALCRVFPVENEESSIYMDILLKNNKAANLSGTAVLRADNGDVSVEQDTVRITSIGGGMYRTLQSADSASPSDAAYYAGTGYDNLFKFKSMAEGVYPFTISFTLDNGESWEEQFIAAPADSSSSVAGVPGANVAEKLQYIAAQSKNDARYFVTVRNDETLSPRTITSLGNNVTVTLRSASAGNVRTLSLSGNGSLLTVSGGITLNLENIVLRGHGSNNSPLVKVDTGATLIIDEGASITGNTNNTKIDPGYNNPGGLFVNGGIVIMRGGEISDNKAGNGGGIFLNNQGSFEMKGGIIKNNQADYGGGVYIIGTSTFYMTGGEISGNKAVNWAGGIFCDSRWSNTLRKFATDGIATSGIIYGSTAPAVMANTANQGAAIHCRSRKRDATLGLYDEISTSSNEGWE